jgi:hypothetical protein
MWRMAAFVAFEFSTAIGAAYVAGRLIAELGFGYSWAGPVSAVAFIIAMMVINRRIKTLLDPTDKS